MTDRDQTTESVTELPTPLSVLYSVVEDAQRYKDYLEENIWITSRRMTKESTTTNLPTSCLSYGMKLAEGPSGPRVCLPSGWPTAEFSSVLARSISNLRDPLLGGPGKNVV